MKLLEKIKIKSPQLLIDQSLKTQLNPTNIKLMKLGQCNNLCRYMNEVHVDMQNKYRLTCELRMCWQTKKVYIDIRNKYYHNNETENYNARVKKNFKHAPLLDFTDTKKPSPYENPCLSLSPLCYVFCHYLCTPVSPWAHPTPVSHCTNHLCSNPVYTGIPRSWYPMNDFLLLIKACSVV